MNKAIEKALRDLSEKIMLIENIDNKKEIAQCFNNLIDKIYQNENENTIIGDEWLKDKKFSEIFKNWCKALQIENINRKTAILQNARKLTKNDIEWAKDLFLNAAQYGTLSIEKAIEHVPKPRKAIIKTDNSPKPHTNKAQEIEQIKQIMKNTEYQIDTKQKNIYTDKELLSSVQIGALRKLDYKILNNESEKLKNRPEFNRI